MSVRVCLWELGGGCSEDEAEALHCAAKTFLVSILAAQLETASAAVVTVLTEVRCKIACSKVHG